jgi:ribonuclease Z
MSLTTSGGIKVTGAWTRAGLGSCVRVEGPNKFDDILFDCGVCEAECVRAGFVFISHGHVDHIGACVMHARAKMLTSRQAIYYVPVESVGPLEDARIAFSKMDGKDIPMKIIPIGPGDSINVSSDLIVKVFRTIHRVPSQGYALYKRTIGSLLEQYLNIPNIEIRELKRSGVQIRSEDTESLELVYTGDTVFEALMLPCNKFVLEAPILILELTYLDGDKSKAIDRGHIHLDDIVQNSEMFKNQQIVFVHLSERYAPYSKALNMLRDGLPANILDRSVVSLRSFGSGEHLTKVSNVDWNKRRAEVGWGWGRQVRPFCGTGHVRGSGNHSQAGSSSSQTNHSDVKSNTSSSHSETEFNVEVGRSSSGGECTGSRTAIAGNTEAADDKSFESAGKRTSNSSSRRGRGGLRRAPQGGRGIVRFRGRGK